MTWWCSATGLPWSWSWRAYPGVWLFVALLGTLYLLARSRHGDQPDRRSEPAHRPSFPSVLWGLAGLVVIWAALDWPLGTLGAGYLASAHAASYILLSLVGPPLLVLGIPPSAILTALARPAWAAVLRFLAKPLVALAVYSALVLVTHIPDVVDSSLRSQVGSLAVDLAWLVGGLVLWWPVIAPPEVSRLSRPVKMLYLFLSTLPPTIPSAFLTFSDYPLYAVYELAPRVLGLGAHDDQQIAGLTMKIIGDVPVWIAFAVIFFRWAGEEHRRAPPPPHPSATPPSPPSPALPAS
jgi:putative membrane protein